MVGFNFVGNVGIKFENRGIILEQSGNVGIVWGDSSCTG
jgi:hypothetical protein